MPAMRRAVSTFPAVLAVALSGALVLGCGADDDTTAPTNAAGVDLTDCPAGHAGGLDDSAAPDPVVAAPTIDGVEVFPEVTHNHVDGCVDYAQNPPVGGDHAGVWQSCGFYSESIVVEQGVHSMEHGAVWITYDPELTADDLDALEALAADFVLVTPWNRDPLPSPVVASAWGLQLQADGAGDPRLAEFVASYANRTQNREAGAPCLGGSAQTI